MARRALSRVFVVSGIRDLAKDVQRELASSSIKVENFPVTDIESEDKVKQLQEVEVLLCGGSVLVKLLKAEAVPNLKWAQSTWAESFATTPAVAHDRQRWRQLVQRSTVQRPNDPKGLRDLRDHERNYLKCGNDNEATTQSKEFHLEGLLHKQAISVRLSYGDSSFWLANLKFPFIRRTSGIPKQDFILTRSGSAYSTVMGEYVVGQIVARERNFAGMKMAQDKKEFRNQEFFHFRPLQSLSIGILGYGTIGKRVAEMCKFMGMTVWAVNRTQNTSPSPHVDHFRGMDGLGEVLQNVDYLCSILPHTPATCDLLSGEVLKPCQEKKSVLINIGRGNVISDESLIRAIREGWLGGAVLDVFNQEPLPASSELWSLPNVVISPHVSGAAVGRLVAGCFVENVKLYMAGQPLRDVMDWEKGY